MKRIYPWMVLLPGFICCCQNKKQQILPGKKTVEVIQNNGRFGLYRNGRPYVIKGACVLNAAYLRQAKESGANSIRTYNTDNARNILDAAASQELTVTLGLRLPYADIEMDYRDDKAVAQQVEKLRKEVLKYKDHPALLMWSIGNELSLHISSSSVTQHLALLKAINRIAKMIHAIDPNHPTTTTIPFIRKSTISAVDMFCNNLDVISINSFETLDDLPQQARHYNKPYIVSEYGANGYWLTAQTDWNTRVEQTSQEKCAFIIRQSKVIQSDTFRCLGSYAFIWGHKLEYTSSWFSLFTEEGEPTQVTDALQYIWTGKWPAHRSPAIHSITINNRKSDESIYLPPGKTFTVSITTGSSDTANEYVTGQLYPDDLEVSELYMQPNYKQATSISLIPDRIPLPVNYTTVNAGGKSVHQISLSLQAPATRGAYRLFLYLHNRQRQVATANACFYVHE